MKRQIKKITQLIVVFCFTAVTLVGCAGEDEEIFDSAELEMEMTDEEGGPKDKPEKPG